MYTTVDVYYPTDMRSISWLMESYVSVCGYLAFVGHLMMIGQRSSIFQFLNNVLVMLSRDNKLIIDRPLRQPPFLKKKTGGACVPTRRYIYIEKEQKIQTGVTKKEWKKIKIK